MGDSSITVVETEVFARKASSCMSDEEREAFIVYIACNPEAGEIMPELPLFLLTVFAKSEQANLSQQERNDLKRLTAILVKEYQTRKRE